MYFGTEYLVREIALYFVRERRSRTEFANLVLRVLLREIHSRSKIWQSRVPGKKGDESAQTQTDRVST